MRIDFEKERNTFLGYCMINAVTHFFGNKKLDLPKTEDGNFEVQFIVNGVELPLYETFKDIEDQIDESVRKKALELLEEKFSDLTELTYEIVEDLKRRALDRLGLQVDKD